MLTASERQAARELRRLMALAGSGFVEDRLEAAEGLGRAGDPRGIVALAGLLEDACDDVRRAAEDACPLVGTSPPALRVLYSGERKVRAAGAEAVGRLRVAEAMPRLGELLEDHDRRVRRSAAWALGEIGGTDAAWLLAGALASDDADVRALSAGGLRRCAPEVSARFLAALAGPSPEVAQTAAQALGALRDPGAAPALIAALQHPNRQVQWAAAHALGDLGDTRAIVPLSRIIETGPRFLGVGMVVTRSEHDITWACAVALQKLQRATRFAPAELEAAPPPAGRGTEPEAAPPPACRGTEPEAGTSRAIRRKRRR